MNALGKASKNTNWRVVTAILTATTLLFSTISSTAITAFADNSANLKALPKESLVDDGNSQLLELKFELEAGSILQVIKITIDEGTPDEKELHFDAEGNILDAVPDPAFELVFGSVTMLSDGYYAIGEAKGKFVIAMNKTLLGAGDHEALAEVMLNGETLTATDSFTLKPSVPLLPDLVAKHFFAPTTIKQPLGYITFTIETNEGHVKAKQHHVQLFLSEDNVLDSGDEEMRQKTVGNLKAGWFKLVPIPVKLDKNADTGIHHLFVKVDSKDKIEEISEDNNVLSKQVNITPH